MKKIQKEILDFCKTNNMETTSTFRILDLLSELGELAKEVLKTTEYGKKQDIVKTENLELEMGDVMFSLICLANTLDIDLQEVLTMALNKYKARIAKSNDPGSGK